MTTLCKIFMGDIFIITTRTNEIICDICDFVFLEYTNIKYCDFCHKRLCFDCDLYRRCCTELYTEEGELLRAVTMSKNLKEIRVLMDERKAHLKEVQKILNNWFIPEIQK